MQLFPEEHHSGFFGSVWEFFWIQEEELYVGSEQGLDAFYRYLIVASHVIPFAYRADDILRLACYLFIFYFGQPGASEILGAKDNSSRHVSIVAQFRKKGQDPFHFKVSCFLMCEACMVEKVPDDWEVSASI